MDYNQQSRIIITCNKRLSLYVEKEVTELGFAPVRVFQTGVELRGSMNDCIRLNLHLRCASQVHYSLDTFMANSPDDLYRKVNEFPWEDFIDIDGYVSVGSTVDNPTIRTPLFANVKMKDAIADRLRTKFGKRPDSGPSLDHMVVHLYWKDDEAEIFIDTSGETLAKHGYRMIPGKAPMLEALAAATIMATKWDRQSPFINPMCGSSTLAIEAAMIATKRVPGLYRENYSFMHFLGYDETIYKTELRKVREQVEEVDGLLIAATDIRQDAIDISKVNAEMAGVDHLIHFGTGDFALTSIPAGSGGVIFFNPEYGERLGELAELERTYERIGDFMKKNAQGYTGYVFTGNMELAKKIGLKASRRLEFYNAKIDCRLLEYELYSGTRRKDETLPANSVG
jgi:23S rRNA G2445 N2-methylase RlmL